MDGFVVRCMSSSLNAVVQISVALRIKCSSQALPGSFFRSLSLWFLDRV